MPIKPQSPNIYCNNTGTYILSGGNSSQVSDPCSQSSQQNQNNGCTEPDSLKNDLRCYREVADGVKTGFILPWYVSSKKSLFVFVNGYKIPDTSYILQANLSNEVSLVQLQTPPASGEIVEVLGFLHIDELIHTAFFNISQPTQELIVDWVEPSNDKLMVFVNNTKVRSTDYTLQYELGGKTRIIFSTAISPSSVVHISGFKLPSTSVSTESFVGDGIRTTFSAPWVSKNCGNLFVFVNGVLVDKTFYNEQVNGGYTDVVFVTAPGPGDEIEFLGFFGFIESNDLVVDGLNLGVGEFVYKGVSFNDKYVLEFKSLNAGPGISISSDPYNITIESTLYNNFQNTGTGVSILSIPSPGVFDFKTLVAGPGITIADSGAEIQLSANTNISTLNGYPATDYAKLLTSVGNGVDLVYKASATPDYTLQLCTIKGGSGIVVNRVNDVVYISDANGGNYVGVTNDYVVELDDAIVGVKDTSSPRTITLPDPGITGAGKRVTISDETGNASNNPITINVLNGSLIEGNTSVAINTDYGTKDFYSNNNKWFIASTGSNSSSTVSVLNDLLDVSVSSSLSQGDFLNYDGTIWQSEIGPKAAGMVFNNTVSGMQLELNKSSQGVLLEYSAVDLYTGYNGNNFNSNRPDIFRTANYTADLSSVVSGFSLPNYNFFNAETLGAKLLIGDNVDFSVNNSFGSLVNVLSSVTSPTGTVNDANLSGMNISSGSFSINYRGTNITTTGNENYSVIDVYSRIGNQTVNKYTLGNFYFNNSYSGNAGVSASYVKGIDVKMSYLGNASNLVAGISVDFTSLNPSISSDITGLEILGLENKGVSDTVGLFVEGNSVTSIIEGNAQLGKVSVGKSVLTNTDKIHLYSNLPGAGTAILTEDGISSYKVKPGFLYTLNGTVVARNNASGSVALFEIKDGLLEIDNSLAGVFLNPAVINTVYSNQPLWSVSVSYNTSTNEIEFAVSSNEASVWAANIEIISIGV